jgi:hypothetical protein
MAGARMVIHVGSQCSKAKGKFQMQECCVAATRSSTTCCSNVVVEETKALGLW